MSRPFSESYSLSLNATGTTGASGMATASSSYPWNRGYNPSSWTTNYARFQLNASSTSTNCYVYYTYTLPEIPSFATIDSVSCSARIARNSYVNNSYIQLYTNTTAKGSQVAFSSTSTTGSQVSLTSITSANAGSWTVSEINNLRLRIVGRRTSTSYNGFIYFWGSTITVNYTVSGTMYTVTASSFPQEVTPSPLVEDVLQGDSHTVRFDLDATTFDDYVVTDNGVDVTSSLVRVANTIRDTFSGYPSSYDSTNSHVSSIDSTNGSANGLTPATSTTRATFGTYTTANSETYVFYNFDCSSIPSNANILSVRCDFKCACSTNYFSKRYCCLCVGTTEKTNSSQEVDTRNTSANNSTIYVDTINSTDSWTRAELDNLKIKYCAVRNTQTSQFNMSFYGATLTIEYECSGATQYYWTYSLSNIAADHTILVDYDGAFEPPEEDPSKTYYPVTVSSINAVTEPSNGTTRVESGTDYTVTIYPSDPQLTLALDNGVDISDQLVGGTPTNTYTVTTKVSGATYGFVLDSGSGYYVSENKAVSSSAAVCRVNFDFESDCLVTFQFINYAEATYDFGVFGKVDTTLSTSAWNSSGNSGDTTTDAGLEQLRLNTSAYNLSTAQTLTYTVPAGTHYIDIKYGKDQASNENNDSLQWKITSIEPTSATGSYTYRIRSVTERHSLIFVFGNVTYYFVNSSGTNSKLYPDGQMVVLDNGSYKLVIVPDDINATVRITDNNVDRTSQLELVEGVDRQGNRIVNYIYQLSSVGAAHTLVVSCDSVLVYMKSGNSWATVSKVYRKTSGSWTEVTGRDLTELFQTGMVYVHEYENNENV